MAIHAIPNAKKIIMNRGPVGSPWYHSSFKFHLQQVELVADLVVNPRHFFLPCRS